MSKVRFTATVPNSSVANIKSAMKEFPGVDEGEILTEPFDDDATNVIFESEEGKKRSDFNDLYNFLRENSYVVSF